MDIDNDGYYQQLDEDRGWDLEDDIIEEQRVIKRRNEASYKDSKYDELDALRNTASKNGRRKFCEDRHKYHEEKAAQSQRDYDAGKFANLKPSEVACKCQNCRCWFIAKKADRKRGWARNCSKSCKAQNI